MNRAWLTGMVVAVVLAPAHGGEPDRTKLAKIGPRMQKFVDDGVLAGAVTVVGNSKGVLQIDSVGKLRLDPSEPMVKDSVFRIASMTKPITAVGIMMLVDEGKVSVDDPVEKHLPEFRGQMLVAKRTKDLLTLKKPSRPITLRDLLTHTSGLPFFPAGIEEVYGKRQMSLKESILVVSQRPLEFEPGSQWAYCNSGIDTLGRVIEVVSGKSYESFLAERIFTPLGMKDTTFRPTKEQMKRLAELYGQKDGKLIATPWALLGKPEASRHPIPAGGLYSTAGDIAKFYQMTLNGGTLEGKKILSSKSLKTMTAVQTGDLKCGFTSGMGFGYGFAVVKKPEGATEMLSPGSYGHGGAFGTQSWADPKKDLFVILMIGRTSLKNADASEMRTELQRLAVEATK